MVQREGSGCCLPPACLPLWWWGVEPDNVCRLDLAEAGGTGGEPPQAITLLTLLAKKSKNKGLLMPWDLQWLDKCTGSGTRKTRGHAKYT